MDAENTRKRRTRFTRAARILKRARDGFAYDADRLGPGGDLRGTAAGYGPPSIFFPFASQ